MAKPRVFIGASRENQDVAEAIQQSLDHASEVEVWDQGTFGASQFPLESLELKLDAADFAVFVFSPDDVTMMRGQERNTVRDNVVFELGLFIGRLTRKRTFLVVPRSIDMHFPSDLLGLTPLDYDASRTDQNLRAALGPACTSIRAALKEHGPLTRPSREVAAQEAESSVEDEIGLPSDYFTPDESWDYETYRHRYFVSTFLEKTEEATNIDTAFRANGLVNSAENLAVWEANGDWVHILRGDNRGIERFRQRVKSYPNSAKLKDLLGRVLSHYGNDLEAQKIFESAAEISTDPELTGALIVRAIDASEAAKVQIESHKYRSILISSAGSEDDNTPKILGAMKALAEKQGLAGVARGIDELRMKASPDNINLRFELAHQHSEEKQSALSMYHYQAIPEQERNGTAWNNLGVAFANLEMPGHAVQAYLAASAKGETIADGNLAYKLVDAGFLDEAKRTAERAVKIEGHHENVVGALEAIRSTQGDERQKEIEALSAARLEQERLLELGRAALSATESDILGLWETPDGTIEVRANDNGKYTGTGQTEREAAVGLGLMLSPRRKQKETTDVEYRWTRFGNVLEGNVSRRIRDYKPTNLLGLAIGTSERMVIVQVADDGQSMAARETSYETISSTWKRVQSIARHDEGSLSAAMDAVDSEG